MNINDGELISVRMAGREIHRLIERLHAGEVEKFVLLDQQNTIRAVLCAPSAYPEGGRGGHE